jgi:steroid delta-isomerase-like uncharacterized protein
MPIDPELAAARADVVRDHMESENRGDYEATLETFSHPRYELIGTGEVFDGEAAVRQYFEDTRLAFPDQRNRLTAMYQGVDAIMVEFLLEGTHLGPMRGLPPTGRAFSCEMSAMFAFEPAGTRIVCERVYFDAGTILRQLGLASDPLSLRGKIETAVAHPVTVATALLRGARSRVQTR